VGPGTAYPKGKGTRPNSRGGFEAGVSGIAAVLRIYSDIKLGNPYYFQTLPSGKNPGLMVFTWSSTGHLDWVCGVGF
jgi:hypothetical protein